jgi:hypothetical protein
MRRNRSHSIVFALDNQEEYKDFEKEECPAWMDKKDFRRIYSEATSAPHSFFYVNTKAPREQRFAKSFETVYVVEPK